MILPVTEGGQQETGACPDTAGTTLPTQRQGTLRSTAQPQLPQQPLPPETALQQTSVRLPQQPVSTVVTRLSQPSGPNTAARIVQLPTQPIPQNTVRQCCDKRKTEKSKWLCLF